MAALNSLAIEIFFDSDGDPWGLFFWGHVDLAAAKAPLRAKAAREDIDMQDAVIGHHWIYDAHAAGDEQDEECHWHRCEAGPGAVAITGVLF